MKENIYFPVYIYTSWEYGRKIWVQDILFMTLAAADPSRLTLWAVCQVVVDTNFKHCQAKEHCLCVCVYNCLTMLCVTLMCVWCSIVAPNQLINTGCSCFSVCASVRYDQYQVQTERHKDQWAVIMKSRLLMIISQLLMNLECHVC